MLHEQLQIFICNIKFCRHHFFDNFFIPDLVTMRLYTAFYNA